MKKFKIILSVILSVLMIVSMAGISVSATGERGLSCEIQAKDVPVSPDYTPETTVNPYETTESTQVGPDGTAPPVTVTEPEETTDPPGPDCDSKPINSDETTDPTERPEPDCDSKPANSDETTDPTDPPEPDCDSKPANTDETTDPQETTDPTVLDLTGPDGTAPTDPQETTDPQVTTVPSTETPETTTSTQPTQDTTAQPSESTVPQSTDPSTPTVPESTEPTVPDETQPDSEKFPCLNAESIKLNSGEIFQLEMLNVTGRVRFTSSDTKKAIVSSSGKITALKKGTVNITAKIYGKTYQCKVKVKNNPKLTKNGQVVKTIQIKKGKKVTLDLIGKAEAIDNIYSSDSIAKISAGKIATKIKVKGLKKGTTTLTIRVNNAKNISLTVVVK